MVNRRIGDVLMNVVNNNRLKLRVNRYCVNFCCILLFFLFLHCVMVLSMPLQY